MGTRFLQATDALYTAGKCNSNLKFMSSDFQVLYKF